jgi:hypothetical protein
MNSSNLIVIQQPKSQDKLEALKAFLKSLNIKFEYDPSNEVLIKHQQFVLNRLKTSKEEDLLDWENIKDDFDGIKIEPAAKIDIQNEINYYNEHQKGLGGKFHQELKSYFKAIQRNPFYEIRYKNIRCLILKKFPIMIHFTFDDKK